MKKYARLARQHGLSFCGYTLPIGAIYGRDNSRMFVCDDYSGINSGKLTIKILKDSRWVSNTVTKESWQFQAVISVIRNDNNGMIPVIIMPRRSLGKIVGQPYARRVNYRFTPTGISVGSLVRQSHDNADHYGGGSNIRNEPSYWQNGNDMMRTGTDWELGGFNDKGVVKLRNK